MAITLKQFNAPQGFAVGALEVISNIGNVTANNLSVTHLSNLGNIGNIQISGGAPGQFLASSGNGSIYWRDTPSGNLTVYTRSGASLIPVPIPLENQTLLIIGRDGNVYINTTSS